MSCDTSHELVPCPGKWVEEICTCCSLASGDVEEMTVYCKWFPGWIVKMEKVER